MSAKKGVFIELDKKKYYLAIQYKYPVQLKDEITGESILNNLEKTHVPPKIAAVIIEFLGLDDMDTVVIGYKIIGSNFFSKCIAEINHRYYVSFWLEKI